MIPFVENSNITAAVMPLDLDTDRTGDYVNVANCQRMGVLAVISPGTAGDDPTFTLNQATTAAGGSTKVATVITAYWTKQAATDLTSTGTWTKSTQTAASTVAGNATSAEQAKMYYFEVDPATLDVANGFDWISVDVALAASGGAQYGTIIYIPIGGKYPQATVPSIIA